MKRDRERHPPALIHSYRQLMRTTYAVVARCGDDGPPHRPALADRASRFRIRRLRACRISCNRCGRSSSACLTQTRARILGGDTHVPDKVLSIFEPHTETIRKGKIVKPNEFGKLITIQESEDQIITAYDVHPTRPADVTLWQPRSIVIRPFSVACRIWPSPIAASARRAMSKHAIDRGVRRVILPWRGPKSLARRAY